MHLLALLAGLLLILVTLVDGFESILLPRRVNNRFRYSRLYYSGSWSLWRGMCAVIPQPRWRESLLGVFGPLSVLGLFGSWVASLILGFAILHWSTASMLASNERAASVPAFTTYLYLSGTTFFTLGLGDERPIGRLPRLLTVAEAGVGFGFLAIIISYLPVLYQAFSRREVTISLLDARAGSPPGAGEFLVRLTREDRLGATDEVLREWERWCAELLESHLSFPALAYYRSQHGNQSWLSALATMLDTCALLLASFPASDLYQTQLTFAMGRHAAVDIALIFGVPPSKAHQDRLPSESRGRLHELLRRVGIATDKAGDCEARFDELRGMYEPFLAALSVHFELELSPLLAPERSADNWQRSAWMPRTPGIGSLPAGKSDGDHFD